MSVANVAQLAVDLLIATLNLKRIGIFDARDLIPVVGGREEGEEGVTTPLERELLENSPRTSSPIYHSSLIVYGKEGLNVVVIQQRSPALKVSI